MSFRPGDSKREEFRKYLEKAGLLDAFTRALVNLYNEIEKPADPLQYVRDMVFPNPSSLSKEMEDLKSEIASLKLENDELKSKIASSVAEPANSEVSELEDAEN